jgi:hypothetical protein
MIETEKGTLEIDRGGTVRRFDCAVIHRDPI